MSNRIISILTGASAGICLWTVSAIVEAAILSSHSFTDLFIDDIPSLNLVVRICITVASAAFAAASILMRVGASVSVSRGDNETIDQPNWFELQRIEEHYIWRSDANGHITYLSPAWEKLMGLPVKSFYGKTFRDLQLEGPDGPISEPVPWQVVGQSVSSFPITLAGQHGRRIDLFMHASAQMGSFKTVVSVIGVAHKASTLSQLATSNFHLLDRWNLLADLISSYVVIFAPTGEIQYVNGRITEAARTEVIGRSIFEFIPAESHDTVKRYVEHIRKSFETNTYEVQAMVPVDPTWYSCRVGPVVEDGKVVALAVVAHNINDQKSLQISHAKLVHAIEQAAESIVLTDPTGTIEYVNPAFETNTGYTREEAIGQNPRILKSGLQPPEFYEDMWTVLGNGGTWHGEFINRHKDGSLFTEQATVSPYYDNRGQLQGYIASKVDISKRKTLEQEVRRSQIFLKHIINSINNPVFVKNSERQFVLLNETGCRIVNKSLDEIIGYTDYDIFPKESADYFTAIEDGVFESGKSITTEEKDVPIGADIRQFLTSRSLFKVEGSDEQFLVGLATDVTELKKLESELAQTRRLKLAGQVAGQIAHDINNLLTPIINAPELLIRMLDPEPNIRKIIDRMQKGVNQLSDITQDLLTLGRRGNSTKSELDLSRIVLDCLAVVDPPDCIKIKSDLQRPIQSISGATSQITRSLVNILQNAIDAMDKKGEIKITTRTASVSDHPVMHSGNYVIVSIADSGPGMSVETRIKIFEPYFTTKATDNKHGSGLGLCVVHEVMKDHGGYIELDSTIGSGTTFTLYFPIEVPDNASGEDEARQVVIHPSRLKHALS